MIVFDLQLQKTQVSVSLNDFIILLLEKHLFHCNFNIHAQNLKVEKRNITQKG